MLSNTIEYEGNPNSERWPPRGLSSGFLWSMVEPLVVPVRNTVPLEQGQRRQGCSQKRQLCVYSAEPAEPRHPACLTGLERMLMVFGSAAFQPIRRLLFGLLSGSGLHISLSGRKRKFIIEEM